MRSLFLIVELCVYCVLCFTVCTTSCLGTLYKCYSFLALCSCCHVQLLVLVPAQSVFAFNELNDDDDDDDDDADDDDK